MPHALAVLAQLLVVTTSITGALPADDGAYGVSFIQVAAVVGSERKAASDALTVVNEEPSSPPNLACNVVSSTDVDADRGGRVVVSVSNLPPGAQVSCSLGLAWDGWVLTSSSEHDERLTRSLEALQNGPTDIVCKVPPFPLAGEGPVELVVSANVSAANGPDTVFKCNAVPLWYSTRLVASFSQSPYFASRSGELLIRTNASAASGELRIRASGPGGEKLVDAPVSRVAKASFSVSFSQLRPDFNGTVTVELVEAGKTIASRLVRLQLVASKQRGSSAVDHKRRSLLVDGRPFFPIGWFSTYLSYGERATMDSLVDMARRGVNSIMLYSLIGGGETGPEIFHDRGKAPDSPKPLLDAAEALGIKVQVYLLDITRPLANGSNVGWDKLERAVVALRDHPAVLSWYIADDLAGPYLPEVYRRIKQLDPHHIVTMAIAGSGDAYRSKYLEGADVIMVETYPKSVDFAFSIMNVITRWPLEFMPAVTCGRAWTLLEDRGVITPEVYFSQLYHALIAGATGEMWFAYRNTQNWNNPGMAIDGASLKAAQQLLDLAPALASSTGYSANPPPVVTVSATLSGGDPAGTTAVRARAFSEETGCVTLLLANGLNEPVKAVVSFARGSLGIFDGSTAATEALVPFELAVPPRRVPVVHGELTEWLPALGVQAFRLNGTSGCAVPELSQGVLEADNLIYNPSFEQFGAFVSSPLYWDCGASPRTTSTCFSDALVRLDRRHSGRFVTGLDAGNFSVTPTIAWTDKLPAIGTYEFVVSAQADVPMLLQVGVGADIDSLASVELADEWRQVRVKADLEHKAEIVLRVNTSGVLWLDDAHLRLVKVVAGNVTDIRDKSRLGQPSGAQGPRSTSLAALAAVSTFFLGW